MITFTRTKSTPAELVVWAALALLGGCAAGWIDSTANEVQSTALVIMLVCFALTLPGRAGALWIAGATALGAEFILVVTSGNAVSGALPILIAALIGAYGGRVAGLLLETATAPLDDASDASRTPWAHRAASSRFLLAAALVTVALLGLPATTAALVSTGHPAARWLAIVWQTLTLLGWIGLARPILFRRPRASLADDDVNRVGLRPIDLGTHMLIVALLGAIHATLIVAITGALFIPLVPSARVLTTTALVVYLPVDMLAYLAILTLGYLSDVGRLGREAAARDAALRAESLDSRLGALRARLNPHFLFNALNSVAVLARSGKSDETVSVIEGLTALLRYVLDDRRAMVPLREEMDFVRQYLAVQQVRFGARLTYSVDADQGAASMLVPQLLLQPIVENAVEHGVSRALDGGSVRVRASRVGDRLHVTVEDDGPGPAGAAPVFGIGLANTRERLVRLYADRASLALEPLSPRGTRVAIILPADELTTA